MYGKSIQVRSALQVIVMLLKWRLQLHGHLQHTKSTVMASQGMGAQYLPMLAMVFCSPQTCLVGAFVDEAAA